MTEALSQAPFTTLGTSLSSCCSSSLARPQSSGGLYSRPWSALGLSLPLHCLRPSATDHGKDGKGRNSYVVLLVSAFKLLPLKH